MKKHIAMFISTLNKGGSERVLVNLAEYFYSKGYEITIVTQYKADNEYEISPVSEEFFQRLRKRRWEQIIL